MKWLFVALAIAGCSKNSFTLQSTQASVKVVASPFSLSVRDAAGNELLATDQGPGAVQDSYQWVNQILLGWDGYRSHEGAWTYFNNGHIDSDGHVSFEGGKLAVSLSGSRVHIEVTNSLSNKSGLSFKLGSDHFFGLGERFTSCDFRGMSVYSWAEEGGIGQGESVPAGPANPAPNGPSMTYFPVPFLLSTNGYGLRIEGSSRNEFHLGDEKPDQWRVAVVDGSLILDIYLHSNPLDSIADFTADVGRPPIPAPWVFGPRREVGLGDQQNGVPEWLALRNAGIATTALDDNVHFLPARSELGREGQLQQWTSQLHAEGFKVLGYYTPYISMSLSSAASDLQTGVANNYFVKAKDGSTLGVFFSSGQAQNLATIDLTNPAAMTWFQSLLQRSIDLGYDGWMHDFGEYIPPDAQFFDGRDGLHAHNDFPRLSALAAQQFLDKVKPNDYLFFARSGWAGSGGSIPGVWSGDPEATFDETQGLPASLRAGLNLSMSGAPYWGSDVGGYKCITDAPNDKEMYLRWAALGAVSPLMMNDTACATVLPPSKTKWTIWSDADTTQKYAALSSLHTRLAPYFWTLAQLAHSTGQPLMLHPWLLFPQRAEALSMDDAFFLGPSLFAAPVVRRGEVTKHIWLPPGNYVDLRDFTVYSGDQAVDIPAPLGELPLLLVAGQIIPMLDPAVQTLAPASDSAVVTAQSVSDRLDVQVALAVGQSATMTLSDGTKLTAARTANDSGNSLTAVTADSLPACNNCYLDEGKRLRANATTSIQLEDLQLTTSGSQRIRWDVIRL